MCTIAIFWVFKFFKGRVFCVFPPNKIKLPKTITLRAGKMTQWLRTLAILEDPGSIPVSTWQLTTFSNSSSMGFDDLYIHIDKMPIDIEI